MAVDTLIKSRESSTSVVFVNDTGGPVTITSVTNSGNYITPTAHTQKAIDAGKVIEYKQSWTIPLQTTAATNMFKVFGQQVTIHYTTADGESHSHNFNANFVKNHKTNFPFELNVTLAVGKNGKPRMYQLKRQSNYVNGFPYYLCTSKQIALYFEIAGGFAYWAFLYDGATIAHGDMLPENRDCSLEEAYMLFPMDCSYGGTRSYFSYNGSMGRSTVNTTNKTLTNAGDQYSMIKLTGNRSIRFIYFKNMSSVGGWRNRAIGGISDVKVGDIVYRADRQYSSSPYAVATSSNSNKVVSFIYEFSALTANDVPHSPGDDVLFEWEILQSDYQAVRCITQYPVFTADLTKLGINRNKDGAARCRILRVGNLATTSNEPSNAQGAHGSWSGWKLLPRPFQEVVGIGPYDGTRKSWFDVRLTTGNTGPVYQDCGWDTKITYTVSHPQWARHYPMVYMDDYIAAGVGANMTGEIPPTGSAVLSAKFHRTISNIVSGNYNVTTSSVVYANNSAGPYIRDNDAHWGGLGATAGTYAAGYQCCGISNGGVYSGRHNNACVLKLELDESSSNTTTRPTFEGTGW